MDGQNRKDEIITFDLRPLEGSMLALMEISLIPIGTNSASFSSSVVHAVQIIEARGMKYQLTPTNTIVEGEIDELLETAKEIHQSAIITGLDRVITNITIDERVDKNITIDQQVDIVRQSFH
jgi:uncharacterized protein (TIGR00106 family)